MATVIDALVAEVGFDTSNLNKGQREVENSLRNTQNNLRKSGDAFESAFKNLQELFGKVTVAAGTFFAAVTGGREIREFINDLVESNSTLGRMAKVFDSNISTLTQWQGAATAVGGTVEGMTGSIAGLVEQYQSMGVTGQSSVVPYLRALNVQMTDLQTGKMRSISDILLDLADRFSNMDPARANFFGHALGFDQGTINLLIQGRKAVQDLLDAAKKNAPTDKDIAQVQALQKSWAQLEQSGRKLGQTALSFTAPGLLAVSSALQGLSNWVIAHPNIGGIIQGELGLIGKGIQTVEDAAKEGLRHPTANQPHGITLPKHLPLADHTEQDRAIVGFFKAWYDFLPEPLKNLAHWEQRALMIPETNGLDNAAVVSAMHRAGGKLPPEARALLDSIAKSEGAGYRSLYGGGSFTGNQFPDWAGRAGPNGVSHAAGRYQFEPATWKRISSLLGLKDFGAASQDQAAWYLAQIEYASRTGHDLLADLKSGGPGAFGRIGAALSRQWASLPGGAQQRVGAAQFGGMMSSYSHSRVVNIGTINVNAPNARTNRDVGRAIGSEIDHLDTVTQANSGPN